MKKKTTWKTPRASCECSHRTSPRRSPGKHFVLRNKGKKELCVKSKMLLTISARSIIFQVWTASRHRICQIWDVRLGVKTESQSAAPTNTDRMSEQSAKVLCRLSSCSNDSTSQFVSSTLDPKMSTFSFHINSFPSCILIFQTEGNLWIPLGYCGFSPGDTGGLTDGLWHTRKAGRRASGKKAGNDRKWREKKRTSGWKLCFLCEVRLHLISWVRLVQLFVGQWDSLISHLSVLFICLGTQLFDGGSEAAWVWGADAVQAGSQKHSWSWRRRRQHWWQWTLYQTGHKEKNI